MISNLTRAIVAKIGWRFFQYLCKLPQQSPAPASASQFLPSIDFSLPTGYVENATVFSTITIPPSVIVLLMSLFASSPKTNSPNKSSSGSFALVTRCATTHLEFSWTCASFLPNFWRYPSDTSLISSPFGSSNFIAKSSFVFSFPFVVLDSLSLFFPPGSLRTSPQILTFKAASHAARVPSSFASLRIFSKSAVFASRSCSSFFASMVLMIVSSFLFTRSAMSVSRARNCVSSSLTPEIFLTSQIKL